MICIKGKRISEFLIQTETVTYPMLDTKYLASLPLYKESYCLIKLDKNYHYRLLKYILDEKKNL